jgi:hypothetical protein
MWAFPPQVKVIWELFLLMLLVLLARWGFLHLPCGVLSEAAVVVFPFPLGWSLLVEGLRGSLLLARQILVRWAVQLVGGVRGFLLLARRSRAHQVVQLARLGSLLLVRRSLAHQAVQLVGERGGSLLRARRSLALRILVLGSVRAFSGSLVRHLCRPCPFFCPLNLNLR